MGRDAAGVINSFSFAIPGTPPFPAGPTYARFRCSSQGGLGRQAAHLTAKSKTTR